MEGFYSVREMTRRLGVEAHMLRYWEKELKLDIPRDSRGRRIYGEEEARLLTQVSDYKKAGKPLKLIRTMITLPAKEKENAQEEKDVEKEETWAEEEAGREKAFAERRKTEGQARETQEEPITGNELSLNEDSGPAAPDSQRVQDLLSRMVAQAVRESSENMITEMKESLLKELDYQFRLQAEREVELRREVVEAQEEHFQRLDVLLRNGGAGGKRRLWRS